MDKRSEQAHQLGLRDFLYNQEGGEEPPQRGRGRRPTIDQGGQDEGASERSTASERTERPPGASRAPERRKRRKTEDAGRATASRAPRTSQEKSDRPPRPRPKRRSGENQNRAAAGGVGALGAAGAGAGVGAGQSTPRDEYRTALRSAEGQQGPPPPPPPPPPSAEPRFTEPNQAKSLDRSSGGGTTPSQGPPRQTQQERHPQTYRAPQKRQKSRVLSGFRKRPVHHEGTPMHRRRSTLDNESKATVKKRTCITHLEKYCVYIICGLVFVAGLLMLIFGGDSLAQLKKEDTSSVLGVAKMSAITVLVFGVITIFTSILGVVGLRIHSRFILGIYCVILFMIFTMSFIMSLGVLVARTQPGVIAVKLKETMVLYKTDQVRNMWDNLQRMSTCCGVTDGKGAQEWRDCYRNTLMNKGIKSWKDIPGIKHIPGIKDYQLPDQLLKQFFPFLYPSDVKPDIEQYDEEEDDRRRGAIVMFEPDKRKIRRKRAQSTQQPGSTVPSVGDEGDKVFEQIMAWVKDSEDSRFRYHAFFNMVPVTCCKNETAYKYNESSIHHYRKICDTTNNTRLFYPGCAGKLIKKMFRLAVISLVLSFLLLVGIVSAALVIITPDKYFDPAEKNK